MKRTVILLLLVGAVRMIGPASGATIAGDPDPVPAADEAAVLREAAAAPVRRAPRVPWLTDLSWSEILQRAGDGDRPVLIDFTATWCGPCKLLDVMVFTEKAVINELADVVTFQVDIDKPEYATLKAEFAVTAVPTVVWCDPQGRRIDGFTGYVSSAQFLEIVRGWRGNLTIDRVLSDRQSASPQDPGVLLDVARRQAERGRDRAADVIYRRLLNLRREADPRTVARGMLGLAEVERRVGREDQARRLAARVAGLYLRPDVGDSLHEGLLEAALFQESIGDNEGALASYRALADNDHRNVLALQGYARAAIRAGQDLAGATRAALHATVYSDGDPDVISTLAECYYWRGLYGRAIDWQEKAVAAAPHQQLYHDQLARYREARAADPHGLRRPPRPSD